jgi:hypothetical protein
MRALLWVYFFTIAEIWILCSDYVAKSCNQNLVGAKILDEKKE